jgi:hypothetical protein
VEDAPPPAAGIGNAAAAMGRMAASQARHRRGWSVRPSPFERRSAARRGG